MSKKKKKKVELKPEEIKVGRARLRDMLSMKYKPINHINEQIPYYKAPDAVKVRFNSFPAKDQVNDDFYELLAKDDELIKLLASGDDEQAEVRLKYLIDYMGLESTVAMATLEDGTKIPITWASVHALLLKGLDRENPDAEATQDLKILLELIINYTRGNEELSKDPRAAKSLEGLQLIYDYLVKNDESADDLEKFFKEQIEFMPIPRPAGIEDFLSINEGKFGDEITPIDFSSGNRITFKGRLSIDEQKINEMLRLAFAKSNPYKAKTGLNTYITLPFTETMRILGKPQTDDNRKKFSRQLRKEILPHIAGQSLEIKARNGSFLNIPVGTTVYGVDVRKDRILFQISDPYALYLNAGALSQYSSKTLSLGTQKKPLPFYLAIKLQDHYFHDGNRKRKDSKGNPQPTNTILSINTLLTFCSDMIPSYEYVQETDRGHWVRQIRQPLEEALNEIQAVGLFEWQYCKKGMAEATPKEIRTNDYQEWSSLYITFKLIPDEPDQTERLEHKQERLEAAQEKQAIRDAKAIIRADKIEKHKARQKKRADS